MRSSKLLCLKFGKLVCVFSCTGHFIKMDSVTVAVLQFSWNLKKKIVDYISFMKVAMIQLLEQRVYPFITEVPII